MKNRLVLLCSLLIINSITFANERQISIKGQVLSKKDNSFIKGATIKVRETSHITLSDETGRFVLNQINNSSEIVISSLGYKEVELSAQYFLTNQVVLMEEDVGHLDEVIINTGYYQLPKERATGSFEYIDNDLFNRAIGTNVISRLEGVANGLAFDRRNEGIIENSVQIRIRGQSTLFADQNPLIVVDDFPYEGDINNLNPNDIENITILKDAAAASIWGARAGNGVIVIKTKEGKFNQGSKIQFNSNYTINQKPDLFYNKSFLDPHEFIDVEKSLFDLNFYNSQENNVNKPALSPVVEVLVKQRDGKIDAIEAKRLIDQFKTYDIRSDATDYLYDHGLNQQYSLNVNGGLNKIRYFLSGGLDKNRSNLIGNDYSRITLNSSTTFQVKDNLQVSTNLNFIKSNNLFNGLDFNGLRVGNRSVYPYAQLVDEHGNPKELERNHRLPYIDEIEKESGFLNWSYFPLDERGLSDNNEKGEMKRIGLSARWSLLKGINVEGKYLYESSNDTRNYNFNDQTYYSRDLNNRFVQNNGKSVMPEGGILIRHHNSSISHSGRGQINFQKELGNNSFSGLVGIEAREKESLGDSFSLYGYDEDVLVFQNMLDYTKWYDIHPYGTARIPVQSNSLSSLTDRFLSYFLNASYAYKGKYTLTGSARKDASNLFGVKINQKGVPLWSMGFSWDISGEDFYDAEKLPSLKLRATYGYTGNLDKAATAYTTARYRSDRLTGLPIAEIMSPANPQLRWEKIKIINIGLDVESKNKFFGSFDIYQKVGIDLMGDGPLDPTSGFSRNLNYAYRFNYANIKTKGIDVTVGTNLGNGIFYWKPNLMFNYMRDDVTRYDFKNNVISYVSSSHPLVGKPRYGIYSLHWEGLDNSNGDPWVLINGERSKEYQRFLNGLDIDDLNFHGPALPPYSVYINNTFSLYNLSVSVNLSWKGGYYFRRSSILYNSLFNNWQGHQDFKARWKEPGDELFTNVPSLPEGFSNISSRDQIYQNSSALVEKGDNLRLQDISIIYKLQGSPIRKLFNDISFQLYANNMGVLWRSNKHGIDPDYPNASVLPSKNISFGVKMGF